MYENIGIVIIDETTINLRVYETTQGRTKLLHYFTKDCSSFLQSTLQKTIAETIINEFLASPFTQHIAEWKICSKNAPVALTKLLRKITGFSIEHLSPARLQELLSKGMLFEVLEIYAA